MKKSQNPFGLHTATLYLVVENLERLIDFLTKVFEGELRGEITYRRDRSIQHAEIKIGDSIIDNETMAKAKNMDKFHYTYTGSVVNNHWQHNLFFTNKFKKNGRHHSNLGC